MSKTDRRLPVALSKSWTKWAVESLVLGASIDDIVDVLTSRGISKEDAKAAVSHLGVAQVLEHARELHAAVEKYQGQLDNLLTLDQMDPQTAELAREKDISPSAFFSSFYLRNRPVFLPGFMKESRVLSWTPDLLRDVYGDHVVQVQVERRDVPIWDVFLKGKSRDILLRDYVEMVVDAGSTNEFYMTGNDQFLSSPGAAPLLEDIDFVSGLLSESDTFRNAHLWFGPRGTVSPLHRDKVNVLKAQVYGRKRVLLINSKALAHVYNRRSFYSDVDVENIDPSRFPDFPRSLIRSVDLSPGDCLFIPVGWWHQVRSLEVSMSLSFTNFKLVNEFV